MAGFRTTGLGVLGLALAAAACQPLNRAGEPATAQAQSGRAFAQARCGACHALDQRNVSLDPDAPPFAGVVNQDGVTGNTLAAWLRNAHNYPEEMNFALERHAVDDLVAYMLTLRDPNYRPAI